MHDSICMGFQETYQFLGLTGACKDHHIFVKGPVCGWKCNNRVLAIESWRYKKTMRYKSSPRACWNDEDGVTCSRGNKKAIEYLGSPTTDSQKTLESSSSSDCYAGLKGAAKYAFNDARIVNARAREGFLLLAR